MQIALSLIQNSPTPVRTTWDEDKLNELAQSLKEQGLIQPIKVRPLGDEYEIVYGHRRVEAARRAGFELIDATVEGMDDQQALIQALIENLQREDMTAMDTARALKALKEVTRWNNREIAERGIMAVAHTSRLLSLLDQPVEIQKMLQDDPQGITERHVREVREVVSDDALKVAVLRKAQEEQLSSAQVRRVAESVAAAPGEHAKQVLIDQPYSQLYHDPDFIKDRADTFGAHDPIYSNTQRSHLNEDWKATPEVSNVIALMRSWMGSLTEFRKADELGKMSPEARGFVGRRVRQFAEALLEWADKLEGEDG
jgi:ParB/RepB/Spo0J family partition protein